MVLSRDGLHVNTVRQQVLLWTRHGFKGNGTYVVQNMTVSQTCHDEAVFTSIGVDGSEITETVELNIHAGDEIELTADLPNITLSILKVLLNLLHCDYRRTVTGTKHRNIDGDDLDIQNLELVGENSRACNMTDNGDGTWTVTPDGFTVKLSWVTKFLMVNWLMTTSLTSTLSRWMTRQSFLVQWFYRQTKTRWPVQCWWFTGEHYRCRGWCAVDFWHRGVVMTVI